MKIFVFVLCVLMSGLVTPLLLVDSAWSESAKINQKKVRSMSVNGYVKKDGTRVKPHNRTTPSSSKKDNWSTIGNVNPHNGKKGTKRSYP
ncbi:hypothetical protein Pse7429DRAFT_2631 [Pseudanabaena biceps PCC 7429]|uniref:Uncharacterized protein n=1 Tax=Pseudanabaena biceps PCC 7429 TaxID=927668 RepID=L8MZ83_9CYAN|nr:hypothetical protein Pse7429DRAFT_2631 [Pseudanabaena biceps PCC 7429]